MSTAAATPSTVHCSNASPAIDQRKSVRRNLPQGGIPVICQRGSRVLLSKANGLGERGIFIFTTSPFPVGSSFTLEFGTPHEIRVFARVRSTLPALGMGVEFLALSEESQALLHRWLSSQT